jgi:cation diffusion facilitator CzcD-associated flavoprotein CzcO
MTPVVRARPLGRPSIAIVGAGFGGIAAAVKLRKAGFDRITVLERGRGVGGTWWHNTYPGAEVDTPSIIYSYSFMPWNWSRTHVGQAELQEYIAAVADRFDITPRIRFGVNVDRVEWNQDQQEYAIISGGDEVARANYVITAAGLLSDPRRPSWPGLDAFAGDVFHTAEWDHAAEIAGKRIAVVGTGSTAIQLVPEIAGIAEHVTVFQREPGWIVPKLGRDYTEAERQALDSPVAQRIVRLRMLLQRDRALRGGAVYRPGTRQNIAAEAAARRFINSALADRPDLIELVTPKYPFFGKRPIVADGFYPALLRDNVTLVPHAVAEVTPCSVVDVLGGEHKAEVLVLSTGFKAAQFLSTIRVYGRGGNELHEIWGDEIRAFLGIMMPGFPNFFMIYGPNTNGGSIVSNAEIQSNYIVAAIRKAQWLRASSVEVRPRALEIFDSAVRRRLKGMAMDYGNNYYKSPSGRNTVMWPDMLMSYGALCALTRGRAFWQFESRTGRAR